MRVEGWEPEDGTVSSVGTACSTRHSLPHPLCVIDRLFPLKAEPLRVPLSTSQVTLLK